MIVSPRPSTLTLKAAASLSPDQKPTLNTALTPPPSPPTLHPEGSVRHSWQGQEVGRGSPGPAGRSAAVQQGSATATATPALRMPCLPLQSAQGNGLTRWRPAVGLTG